MLIVVSLFLAAGLDPAVRFFERRGMRRSYAVLTVIVVVLRALALFLVAIVPVIADQVRSLTDNVPHWLDQLQRNRQVQRLDDEYDIIAKIQDYVTKGDFAGAVFGGALGVGLAVLGALFNGFIVTVLTLYFLASLRDHEVRALPPRAGLAPRPGLPARRPGGAQRRRLRLRRVHRRDVRRHLVAGLPVRRRPRASTPSRWPSWSRCST